MGKNISILTSTKRSISVWAVIFIIGTVVQAAANRNVACIYGEQNYQLELSLHPLTHDQSAVSLVD